MTLDDIAKGCGVQSANNTATITVDMLQAAVDLALQPKTNERTLVELVPQRTFDSLVPSENLVEGDSK